MQRMTRTNTQVKTLIYLYARISEDPRDRKRGVNRQMKDLRLFADEVRRLIGDPDAEIAGEYLENDVSAFADRPYYRIMMSAVAAAGKEPNTRVVIAAYHRSRLWRQRVERAQAIEDLREIGAFVAFERGGFFDLSKASDRSQLASTGESDTTESEVKSERVARAALERAQEGRANGVVAYGWQRIYEYDNRGQIEGFHDVEHPEQSAIVREIVRRLLGGESLVGITADLNERKVPSPGAGQKRKHRTLGQDEQGTKWNKTSVKKIALRPANAALRVHHDELYPAAWPRLISDEEYARVKALFAGRAVTLEKPGLRKHLLSWGSVAVCGVCDGPLRSATKGNAGRLTYVCVSSKGCVGRNQAALDAFAANLAIEVLSDASAVDVFRPDETAALAALSLAEGLRAKQAELAEDFAAERITREQLTIITQRLNQQIAAAQDEARRLMPTKDVAVLDGLIGPHAAQRWHELDVARQRAVLEIIGLQLKVRPAERKGPGFDASTIEVAWVGRQ